MKASLLFSVVLFFTFPMWGQKSLRALKQVYTKKELKTFEEQYGNLDLLVFAYDHAISIVSNIGSKNTDIYPLAVYRFKRSNIALHTVFSNRNPG
jgi:hypothetical protein